MSTQRRRSVRVRVGHVACAAWLAAGGILTGTGCATSGESAPMMSAAPSDRSPVRRWNPGPRGLVTHRLAGLGGAHQQRRDADLGYPPAEVPADRGTLRVDRHVTFRTNSSGDVRTWSSERIRERRYRPVGG